MRLVFSFITRASFLFVLTFAFVASLMAQPPNNNNDTVPNFGVDDNDIWFFQSRPTGTYTTMEMEKTLQFFNGNNSGDDDLIIKLIVEDNSGLPLNIYQPGPATNEISYSFDLDALPSTGVTHTVHKENYELDFDIDFDIDEPANWKTNPNQRIIKVWYEVYTRADGDSAYTMVLGQTTDSYVTCEIIPNQANRNKRVANPNASSILEGKTIQGFPNPFSTEVNIQVAGEVTSTESVKLKSLNGNTISVPTEILYSSSENSQIKLITERLAPGMYVIMVKDNKGQIHHTKVTCSK